MKRIFALAILAILSVAATGCPGQIPPNPTTYTCPPSTGTAYTALNQASPTASLTYSWTPASGTYCIVAQSVLGSAVSVPSNTAGPVTATGAPLTASWTAPTTGPAPSGYVISAAPAVQTTLGAPALAPTIAKVDKYGLESLPVKNTALAAPTGTRVKRGL